MHLACRHHVYECHIKNFAKLFKATSGPDNQLFKKLLGNEFSLILIDQNKLCKFKYGVTGDAEVIGQILISLFEHNN